MPIPQYQTFGLSQGLDLGFQSRRDALANAIAQRRLELDRIQQQQQADQAKAQLGLGYAELGEKTAGRVGDERLRGQTLEEQRRSNLAGESLSGQRLGIEGFSAQAQAADAARRSGLAERQFSSQDALGQREQALKEKSFTADQALQSRQQDLRERAQAAAEQQALRQEALEGRKLSIQEKDTLFRNELAKQEFEQKNEQFGQEMGLKTRAQTAQEQQAATDARLRQQQLEQQGSQFGQEFGLKTRAQEAAERQAQGQLGLGYAELTQKGQQFGQDLGFRREELGQRGQQFNAELGLKTRAQAEVEGARRSSDQQQERKLSLSERQQQFFEFNRNLERAVEDQKLSFEQAATLRKEAYQASKDGQDLQKWFYEQQQKAQEFQQSLASTTRGQDVTMRGQDLNFREAMNKPASGLTWDQRLALEKEKERIGDERQTNSIDAAKARQLAGFDQQNFNREDQQTYGEAMQNSRFRQQNLNREDQQEYAALEQKLRLGQQLTENEKNRKQQLEMQGRRENAASTLQGQRLNAQQAAEMLRRAQDDRKFYWSQLTNKAVSNYNPIGQFEGYVDNAKAQELLDKFNNANATVQSLEALRITPPVSQEANYWQNAGLPGGRGSPDAAYERMAGKMAGQPGVVALKPKDDQYGFDRMSLEQVQNIAKSSPYPDARDAANRWLESHRS